MGHARCDPAGLEVKAGVGGRRLRYCECFRLERQRCDTFQPYRDAVMFRFSSLQNTRMKMMKTLLLLLLLRPPLPGFSSCCRHLRWQPSAAGGEGSLVFDWQPSGERTERGRGVEVRGQAPMEREREGERGREGPQSGDEEAESRGLANEVGRVWGAAACKDKNKNL